MSPQETLNMMRNGGHRQVFRRLYAVLPAFKRWVKQHGGLPEEAEDSLQEAMVVFFRQCRQVEFELQVKAETYVFAVAKRVYLSGQRNRREWPLEDEWADRIPDEQDIQELLAREAMYREMQQSLTHLGEKCRELLMRFYYRRESMTAIAAALQLRNEHVAKAMKYKCLEKARQWIAGSTDKVYEQE